MFNGAAAPAIARMAFGETTCGRRGADGATPQLRAASNHICKLLLGLIFYFYFTPKLRNHVFGAHLRMPPLARTRQCTKKPKRFRC